MKLYDYICNQCDPSTLMIDVWHREPADPSPQNPPLCDKCGSLTEWLPSCQFAKDEITGGMYRKGYGYFESRKGWRDHLEATGRMIWEPGLKPKTSQTEHDAQFRKDIEPIVGKIVQEQVKA